MERIYINSSDDYYLTQANDTRKLTIIDLYNNRKSGTQYISFNIYVKEDNKFVDKGHFEYKLNYKEITFYTLDEIISIHKLGKFTLFRYTGWHKLENPINVKGKCFIKLHHDSDNKTSYCNLVEYYWTLCSNSYYTNMSMNLMYDDAAFSIKDIDLYVNGKYILDYTSSELSDIVDSKNYIIGPNSTLPDEVFQEAVTPQEFTLDDYYCNAADGKIFISTTLKDHYPCKNSVLELVIKHHKPSSIIISKNDTNLTKLIKHLVKYDVAITIV
jgi:hypothetical protein